MTNKTLTSALRNRWAKLTDENQHQQVRIEIAEYLTTNIHPRFEMYVDMFKVMQKYVKKGNVPREFLQIECIVTDTMCQNVINNFNNEELINQINKCL